MAVKHKNLYLYLTLACFLGLILVFIFDGYMGVYDTLTVKSGEYQEQKIDADEWTQRYRDFSTAVEWDGKAFFRYEVYNRWFSTYMTDVEVSVWREQEKVSDLIAQEMSIDSFGKGQVEWVLDTAELVPADIPPEQGYQFTVVIRRGEIERKVITHINPTPYPPKPIIAPPR